MKKKNKYYTFLTLMMLSSLTIQIPFLLQRNNNHVISLSNQDNCVSSQVIESKSNDNIVTVEVNETINDIDARYLHHFETENYIKYSRCEPFYDDNHNIVGYFVDANDEDEKYGYDDYGNLGTHKCQHLENQVNFTFKFNLWKYLENNLIGNLYDYKNKNNIKIGFQETSNNYLYWYRRAETWPVVEDETRNKKEVDTRLRLKFSFFNTCANHWIEFSKFFNNYSKISSYYGFNDSRIEDENGNRTDSMEINSSTMINIDYKNNLNFRLENIISAWDIKDIEEQWTRSGVSLAKPIVSRDKDDQSKVDPSESIKKIKAIIKFPYTKTDLATFREKIKQKLAAPIVVPQAKTPIIFDYVENENEQYVKKVFDERLNSFLSDTDFLNKFGNFVNIDAKGNKSLNRDILDIELVIPNNVRGKTGTQQCQVLLKLKNNRKFNFGDSKEPKNEFSVPIDIYIELDPNIDNNIDDHVQIIPYISASNNEDNYYLEEKELNIEVSRNEPHPKILHDFSININPKNKVGKYALIDNDKIPIISKLGTTITLDLEFKVGDVIANKKLVFRKLYNNGFLTSKVEFQPDEILGSGKEGLIDYIEFKVEMKNDKIILSNTGPIWLNSMNIPKPLPPVTLKILKATATVPIEQVAKQSKWIQTEDGQYFEDKKLKYVGTYETFDPFIFNFRSIKIPLNDPVTGEFVGYASRYKPFIRKGKFTPPSSSSSPSPSTFNAREKDEVIFPKPSTGNDFDNQSYYQANLGTYVMKNKTEEGKFDFQIVIKEYNDKVQTDKLEEKYVDDRWIIGVSMNLLSSQANFIMSGYKENKLIEQENKLKYFNEENQEYYRGDYIKEETGMYKPKIVWVNALPPESFLYDPVDANGEYIIPKKHPTEQEIAEAKYNVGYIAELNATGFSDKDYAAIPTFGGYETNFDTTNFVPTGLMPYSEFYTFNKNSLEPKIERSPLNRSGLQTIRSTDDFRQIVLKRPNSNNYLYQFVKIAKSSEEIVKNKDLIDLYGNLKGLDNEPLFVDFWSVPEGKHLMNYLVNEYKIFESEDKVKELSYSELVQYWNIYVNDPTHYDQSSSWEDSNKKDISKLQDNFKEIILQENDLDTLSKKVISEITKQLQDVLVTNAYIEEQTTLVLNEHFKIEDNEIIFKQKLQKLLDSYNLDLNTAKPITFKITMIDEAFKNDLLKPTGSVEIKAFNNKDADKIIDLSQYSGSKLSINTKHPYFSEAKDMIGLIKETILTSINDDVTRIVKHSKLTFPEDFKPTLNRDYKVIFYKKYINDNYQEETFKFRSIEDAIKDALLYETNKNVFYNTLSVEVKAIFNDESHFMINSFHKTIINNSKQKEAIIDSKPFDLSIIKAHDIKINTKHKDFPQGPKEQTIFNLIIERVYNDIYFWARKWAQTNKIEIKYQEDFEIKLIKEFDENNNPIYYETTDASSMMQIIKQRLIDGIENEAKFNRDLYFEVVAISGSDLEQKYMKKINNNYLNEAIEEDDLSGIDLDYNESNDNGLNNTKIPLDNNNGKGSDFDWWWVITPITVFIIVVIVLIVIYIVRKNRRIR